MKRIIISIVCAVVTSVVLVGCCNCKCGERRPEMREHGRRGPEMKGQRNFDPRYIPNREFVKPER